MGVHHIAIATRNLRAAHDFYSDAMGFELVHVQAGVTDAPAPGGWAKHAFYDTGGGMLALWELHDPRVPDTDLAISRGLGLPTWVNHIAFDVPDAAELDDKRDRWLANGCDVLRIDHGWTISLYTDDPDGNMVEWCHTVTPFGEAQAAAARQLLIDSAPSLDPLPTAIDIYAATTKC